MRFIIILLLLPSFSALGQKTVAVSMGNAVKNGIGTTFISLGYKPHPSTEMYFAPSWGISTGGTALFAGAKYNLLTKNRLSPNVDFTYRHSSRTILAFENRSSGGVESYKSPPSDFFVIGIGLSFKVKDKIQDFGHSTLNLTVTYSHALGQYNYTYLDGPFSKSGEESVAKRLTSGFGLTLSWGAEVVLKKARKEDDVSDIK